MTELRNLNDWTFETRPVDATHTERARLNHNPVTQDKMITAGKFPWYGDMVVRNVPLKRGQRYLLKAHFKPAVEGLDYQQPDWNKALLWRFEVTGAAGRVFPSHDMITPLAQYGYERFLFVIEAATDGDVDVRFVLEAKRGTHDMRVIVTTLSIEAIDALHSVDVFSVVRPRPNLTQTTQPGLPPPISHSTGEVKKLQPVEPRASVALTIMIQDASLAQVELFASHLRDIFGIANVQIMPTRIPAGAN